MDVLALALMRLHWHCVANEMVLIDLNSKLAQTQSEDLLQATPFTFPSRFTGGDYQDLEGFISSSWLVVSGNRLERAGFSS